MEHTFNGRVVKFKPNVVPIIQFALSDALIGCISRSGSACTCFMAFIPGLYCGGPGRKFFLFQEFPPPLGPRTGLYVLLVTGYLHRPDWSV